MFNFTAIFKILITLIRSPLCAFISVKGVVVEDGKVWLRLNERQEWELPGGRMEPNEQPAQTVVREVKEELGFDVETGKLLGVYLGKGGWNRVFIIAYEAKLLAKTGEFEIQGELGAASFQAFAPQQLPPNLPEFYRQAILTATQLQ